MLDILVIAILFFIFRRRQNYCLWCSSIYDYHASNRYWHCDRCSAYGKVKPRTMEEIGYGWIKPKKIL